MTTVAMRILGVTIEVAVKAETDAPADAAAEVTRKTGTTEIEKEIEENTNKGIMTTEVKAKKILLEVAGNNGMKKGIETIGTEEMPKEGAKVEIGIIIEVKVMEIEDGGVDGINIHNIHLKAIIQGPIIRTPIIIDHHQWDIKVNINSHLHNTHPIIPRHNIQIHNHKRNPLKH